MQLNLLAIETSTELASVALSVNGELLIESIEGVRSHAQLVLPLIESLLRRANIELSKLDGIVFGEGPGSFTGLRVACSIAKGLAYGQNLPVYPVSTLAAIAESVSTQVSTILVMIDARMNQVFWAYSVSPNGLSEPQVSDVDDIKVPGEAPILLAGVGWGAYEEQLSPSIRQRISACVSVYPDAGAMIRLVEKGGVKAVSANDAVPVYVRNEVTS